MVEEIFGSPLFGMFSHDVKNDDVIGEYQAAAFNI